MNLRLVILSVFWTIAAPAFADDSPQVLLDRLQHLRIDGLREWTDFPEKPDGANLEIEFESSANKSAWTLELRHEDLKQTWNLMLNNKSLGRLSRDENEMVVYFDVPVGGLVAGKNTLRIEQSTGRRQTPDDIRVGQIKLHARPMNEVLNEATLVIEVKDRDSGQHIPSRITIINSKGVLQTTSAKSNEQLAVRPGLVYTGTGKARIGLPAGKYTIYAGRGFEYSLDTCEVDLEEGQQVEKTLKIRREVNTDGYVACDTHVHTLTHSGHGDSTVDERMISLAAEGIELPIATDHNVHIDHDPFARKMNVREYFTPVIGNEVTTRTGHFNVFPVQAGAAIPDFKQTEWEKTLAGIFRTPNVKIAILNHARDVHSGVRPFGPELFNDVVGENLDGWAMKFNAMEVINSGATQTDGLQLFRDWMALLNCGYQITPVGSSDSHDVGRHFVGQGRTYIRCNDGDVSKIDVNEAVDNFRQGHVTISYGLFTQIKVNGKFGSGDIATADDGKLNVVVRVLGPHWTKASHVTLYANGRAIREFKIPNTSQSKLKAGIKWNRVISIPEPKHDVHLVAIATGPGVDGLYWRTAKAYQPTSPDWDPYVIGCSGAVWIDADKDGRKTSAYDYATRLFTASGGDLNKLIGILAEFDEAVAAQAAHLYQSSGKSLLTESAQAAIKGARKNTQAGLQNYLQAWRKNQMARAGR